MKPIKTKYKDILFKSRTEARYAVFFDALRWKWEYEPRELITPVGRYIPDFWLPEHEFFAEVKPEWPTGLELEKMRSAARESEGCLILQGWPEAKEYWSLTNKNGYDGNCIDEALVLLYGDLMPAPMTRMTTMDEFPPIYLKAVQRAQHFRFDGFDEDRKIISERYA